MANTLLGKLGGYDEYSRSVPVVASTTDKIEGEALTSWNLTRYLKNPVVLWHHNQDEIPIGLASELQFNPETGLTARVHFASEQANPLAEQIAQAVREGVVRAVSVGFDHDAEGNAVLLEISLVPIGADENAGTAALNPEAGMTREMNTRPFGPWSDFEDCLQSVMKKSGYDEETAKKVCGKLKHELEDRAKSGRAHYPWDECVSDQIKKGYSEESANKICGSIKAGRGNTPEAKRAAVSAAARELATHRASLRAAGKECTCTERTDADEQEIVYRMDTTRLGKVERTQVGGAKVPATLTRTGVLTYRNPDGSERKELRLPDEVFNKDSLTTLEHAPVIDIKDHTGMVTPDTWRQVSLGHVGAVRRDGKFVASDLFIQDKQTLDMIEANQRTDVSCGYQCRLEFSPGEYEGQKYDCIQRDIRYNHAALCPPNRGRAGPEVGLRLDNNAPVWGESIPCGESESQMSIKVRFDGREFEEGSKEHLDAIERVHNAEIEKLRADAAASTETLTAKVAEEKKRADTAEGRADAAEASLETFKTDATRAAESQKGDWEKAMCAERAKMRSKVRLISEVARFFGASDEDEKAEEEEEKGSGKKGSMKMDAIFDSLYDKSERDLMLDAIKKSQPTFDGTDRSDDYIKSRYDSVLEAAKAANSVDGVRNAMEAAIGRLDSAYTRENEDKDDPVTKARAARDKAAAEAWKTSVVNGGR